MTMFSLLKKLRRSERSNEEEYIKTLNTTLKHLQKELRHFSARAKDDEKLISELQSRKHNLAVEVIDAKDMLFSEVNYRRRSHSNDRDMIKQLQNELRIAQQKRKQFRNLLKDYDIHQEMIRRQVTEMESRIAENENASAALMQFKVEADAAAAFWRLQLVEPFDAANASCPKAFSVL